MRGADLIDSTPKQELLATMLNGGSSSVTAFAGTPLAGGSLIAGGPLINAKSEIKYLHASLMLDANGDKMSKRDGSYSLREWQSEGKSSQELIASLAHSLGLVESLNPVDAQELTQRVSQAQLLACL